MALDYAGPGIRLGLTGRNLERLEGVAEACRTKGATVVTKALAVDDRDAMADWLLAFDQDRPVDLVIANAGISGGTGSTPEGETDSQTRAIFAVNLAGVINTVMPLLGPMRQRGKGQIAIMASLAGFVGFPSAPAYCGSKAAVRVWGEGLRPWLAEDGIGVSVICPGYVRSRITDQNDFPMPFFMEAEKASRIIRAGLAANKARIAFPWPMVAVVRLLAMLPPAWLEPIMRRLPKKK